MEGLGNAVCRNMDCLLPLRERRLLNAALSYFINAEHFKRAKSFREVSCDQLYIGDDVAHNNARHKLGMEVRFAESCEKACAELIVAFRQQLAVQCVLLGIGGIGFK